MIVRLTAWLALVTAHLHHGHHLRWHHARASEYGDGDGQLGGRLACAGRRGPDGRRLPSIYGAGLLGVANKKLPCGTYLRLCARRCVTVRVLDRGPYIPGRSFDLMLRPARDIGFSGVGGIRWRHA